MLLPPALATLQLEIRRISPPSWPGLTLSSASAGRIRSEKFVRDGWSDVVGPVIQHVVLSEDIRRQSLHAEAEQ